MILNIIKPFLAFVIHMIYKNKVAALFPHVHVTFLTFQVFIYRHRASMSHRCFNHESYR